MQRFVWTGVITAILGVSVPWALPGEAAPAATTQAVRPLPDDPFARKVAEKVLAHAGVSVTDMHAYVVKFDVFGNIVVVGKATEQEVQKLVTSVGLSETPPPEAKPAEEVFHDLASMALARTDEALRARGRESRALSGQKGTRCIQYSDGRPREETRVVVEGGLVGCSIIFYDPESTEIVICLRRSIRTSS